MNNALEKSLDLNVSVSFRMSTLLATLFVVGLTTFVLIRYRITTKYSRLSKDLDDEEEEDQSILSEMWREPTDSDNDSLVSESAASFHFDEFLKAIKVFGFLDHEVFTELTKSTQTLRINEGESVKLVELGGFAVVISGAMKVYCKSDHLEDGSGHDLLNEITVASPISSLSSILSLFSDAMDPDRESSAFDQVNATTVAVASKDSTIVIIPADAFRQLTRNYPRATANIVQIILFRWSQVTFRTCQRYLNLTQQFYGTERALNATAKSRIEKNVPSWLIENAVHQLKQRAAEAVGSENVVELRSFGRKSQFATSFEKRTSEAMEHDLKNLNSNGSIGEILKSGSHDVYLSSDSSRRSSEFPGDLLSHANLNYTMSHIPGSSLSGSYVNLTDPPQHQRKLGKDSEESALRRAIVEIMFATIMYDSQMSEMTGDLKRENSRRGSRTESAPLGSPKSTSKKLSGDSSTKTGSEDAKQGEVAGVSPKDAKNHGPGKTSTPGLPRLSPDTHVKWSDIYQEDATQGSFNRPRSNSLDGKRSSKAPRDAEAKESVSNYNDTLDDASEMVELLWYRKGQYLTRYGERCRGLIYVLDGLLEVGHHPAVAKGENKKGEAEGHTYERLYDVETGNITGFLETISSYSSFVDLIAKKDSCVAVISKSYFERLAEVYPLLYISAAKALTTSLTRPMVQLDFALEWISIKSGGKLLQEGTTANAIYFVLNGRVRAYHDKKLIGDFGHGSTIGELETMGSEPYNATVVAVRDTELSRFPRTLVECLARQYPSVTFEMSRMVVQAMRARNSVMNNEVANFSDFKTLAILPTATTIPVEDFALNLSISFRALGREVKVLTSSVVLRYLGKYAFHKLGSLKLRAYLADLEDRYDILLYVADGLSTSQWSRACVDQADCVLLLADGEAQPTFSDVERMVVRSPTRSRAHLVLLHNEKFVKHGSTAKWLRHRPWISAHHHIRMDFRRQDTMGGQVEDGSNPNQPNRVQKKFKQIKTKVQDEIKFLQDRKFLHRVADVPLIETTNRLQYKNDFDRLARVLAGEAIGLVLGGGGARGLSHIGILQALEECGVPIDMIGGTSIGALMGGLYAQDYDIMPLLRKSKQFSVRVSSFWRLLLDLTYPMTAWTTGHAFNRAVWKCLGDSRIEDFWVKYFTNTTNLTLSRMMVHQRGYAWRYIRASMSLAGLLPPIEEKGQMLLDGGYVDNLPVFEMKKMGARYVIAVDVGAVDDTTPLNYGDTLSGVWALINKYNPLSTRPNVPNIAEIQQRLTYVSSVKALEEAKKAEGVLYLRPPIDNYATLDFAKFDEIREAGFKYGYAELQNQIACNRLPAVCPKSQHQKKSSYQRHRRYSF